MSLQVVKFHNPSRRVRLCEMGCRHSSGYPRSASSVAWILARPTYLCVRCAKEWPSVWKQALAGFSEDDKAAA